MYNNTNKNNNNNKNTTNNKISHKDVFVKQPPEMLDNVLPVHETLTGAQVLQWAGVSVQQYTDAYNATDIPLHFKWSKSKMPYTDAKTNVDTGPSKNKSQGYLDKWQRRMTTAVKDVTMMQEFLVNLVEVSWKVPPAVPALTLKERLTRRTKILWKPPSFEQIINNEISTDDLVSAVEASPDATSVCYIEKMGECMEQNVDGWQPILDNPKRFVRVFVFVFEFLYFFFLFFLVFFILFFFGFCVLYLLRTFGILSTKLLYFVDP